MTEATYIAQLEAQNVWLYEEARAFCEQTRTQAKEIEQLRAQVISWCHTKELDQAEIDRLRQEAADAEYAAKIGRLSKDIADQEIGRLREECEAWQVGQEAITDQLSARNREITRLKAALREIDVLAVRHERGAIGKAQKIVRAALTQSEPLSPDTT